MRWIIAAPIPEASLLRKNKNRPCISGFFRFPNGPWMVGWREYIVTQDICSFISKKCYYLIYCNTVHVFLCDKKKSVTTLYSTQLKDTNFLSSCHTWNSNLQLSLCTLHLLPSHHNVFLVKNNIGFSFNYSLLNRWWIFGQPKWLLIK